MDPTRVDNMPDEPTRNESFGSTDDENEELLDATIDSTGRHDPPTDFRAGHPEKVGPYQIAKLLGAGGMGSVYLGLHEDDRSLAAIKVLPASLAREEGFVARFNREISALEKLDCPNVVQLLGHGTEPLEDGSELHYYSMEYVAGETLTERLKREKRLGWEEVIDIGLQICTALIAAHNAGIIHRDLKPSNLIIDTDGKVKLADFGVAQVFASSKLTVTGGIIGTAEYMSPEQAEGRRVTKESDIYSLGAVLYVALTGRPPFPGRNPVEIAQKHRTGQFDAPRRWVPEIPNWLDEVVCKCLSKNVEDRYRDARVLSRRLEEIPKKLELARSEMTGGLTAATVGADGSIPVEQQAGGATFAAEMMRAEIDQEQNGSIARRLLDSTGVLLALLALIGGIAFVMTREKPVKDEDLFARGQELMESKTLTSMRTARDDYFTPLIESDPEKWGPKIEPILRKIELAEVTKGTRSLRGAHNPTTEPQRLLHFALEQRRSGDIVGAEKTLAALREIMKHDEAQAELVSAIDSLRGELTVQIAQLKRQDFIEDAEAKAAELENDGKPDEAAALRQALKTLYND